MNVSCQVCERPGTHQLGDYTFCDIHYEKAKRERGGVWQADFGSVLVLIVFVLAMFAIENWVQPVFTPTTLLLTGFAIALVPAVIWLGFFYRRDRLEPEPKTLVIQMFVLGGLLAGAVGIPLLKDIFQVPNWIFDNLPWSYLLGSVLVIGFSQEFLKYAALRFSVYNSAEFDERTDGIIYATAIGLGYATVLNIAFVVDSGGVELGVGSIRIVLTALAHASFAGIVGYFFSRDKFEERPVWWMPLGVSIAALFNGLFFYLRGAVVKGSLGISGGIGSQWYGLIMAVVLATAVTWFLSRTIHKELATVLASEEE